MALTSLGGIMNDMMDQTSAGDKLRGNSAGRRQRTRPSFAEYIRGSGKGVPFWATKEKYDIKKPQTITNTRDRVPKGFSLAQLSQYTPEQMSLFKRMFSDVDQDSYLSKLAGGDESYFDELEAPAWRQFQEAQGQLGSRYSQLAPGALSSQNGSGFKNAAGQLGSDFAMNLASRRRELQRQAIYDLQGLGTSLLSQRPVDRALLERGEGKQKTAWGSAIGTVGGAVLGGFLSKSPQGAAVGATTGGLFGSGFDRS
jgi:hypothetical protein